jgi:hypothetical protein
MPEHDRCLLLLDHALVKVRWVRRWIKRRKKERLAPRLRIVFRELLAYILNTHMREETLAITT